MQLDWITVAAQIVNFLMLVALLRRFLYRPVLDAMARREGRIAGQLHQAEQRERDAGRRAHEFQQKTDDLESRRQELLDRARADADADRRSRLEEARAEVERQRDHWRGQVAQEWDENRQLVRRRLAETLTEAARRALADLADTALETAMARAFRRRLVELAESDPDALPEGTGPVVVATRFDPDEETRKDLVGAVHKVLGRPVHFVRADDLVGGIELRTDSWKLSWTLAEYVRGLDDRLGEVIALEGQDAGPSR